MAPNHRKIIFSLLLLLGLGGLQLLQAQFHIQISRFNVPQPYRAAGSQPVPVATPTKKASTQVVPKPTTPTLSVPPGEIVYKFYEPRASKKTQPKPPETEPEEREFGYYGIYDHFRPPKQYSETEGYKTLYVEDNPKIREEEGGVRTYANAPRGVFQIGLDNEIRYYADPVPDDNQKSGQPPQANFEKNVENYSQSNGLNFNQIFRQENVQQQKSSDFFKDYQLSPGFYENRGIPQKYLQKLNSFGQSIQNQNQEYSRPVVNEVSGGSGWKGISDFHSQPNQQQFSQPANRVQSNQGLSQQHVPPPPASLTTTVGNSNNDKPITRLIPQAKVEMVPLPPPGEYNIPEIIHSGDYVVRVEKVPLKSLHDAYYNPEIPEEATSGSRKMVTASLVGSATQVPISKGSKLKKKSNSKSKSKSKSSRSKARAKSGKPPARKSSKQKDDDSSQETPVIDDVEEQTSGVANGVRNAVGTAVGTAGGLVPGLVNGARGVTGAGLPGVGTGLPGVGAVPGVSGLPGTGLGSPAAVPGVGSAVDTARGVLGGAGIPATVPGTGTIGSTVNGARDAVGGVVPGLNGAVDTAKGVLNGTGLPGAVPAIPGTTGLNGAVPTTVQDVADTAKDTAVTMVQEAADEAKKEAEDEVKDDDGSQEVEEEPEKESTTAKPDSEEEDTETQSEKPATDEETSEEENGDEGTSTTTEAPEESAEDTSDTETDTDSDSGTTEAPTTTTTTTPKPTYPKYPYPPYPFPPFFFPYPPPPGYPPMPYPPPPGYGPPHKGPYPPPPFPLPYPPPPPGYPPMPYPPPPGYKGPYPPPTPLKGPYGPYPPKQDYNYKAPPTYPPPPPLNQYSNKPISYAYTNSPPPAAKYNYPSPAQGYQAPPPPPQYQAPPPAYQPPPPPPAYSPPPSPPPQYQPPAPNYPPPPTYQPPPPPPPYKDDGYGDKGNPPVEKVIEFNQDIVKNIEIKNPPQYNNNYYQKPAAAYYPQKPKKYQPPKVYQNKPMSYYQYDYRRSDAGGGSGYQEMPVPKRAYQHPAKEEAEEYQGPSGYQGPEQKYQEPKPEYRKPKGYGYKKDDGAIHADIYLGDVMIQGQEYGEKPPKYPVEAYAEEMPPPPPPKQAPSYENSGPYPQPAPQQYQGPPQSYPQGPAPPMGDSYGAQSPYPQSEMYQGPPPPPAYPMQPYPSQQPETAKKPSYFQMFKAQLKKLVPKLRPNSGDAYPPKLDENYQPLANETHVELPWKLGDHEPLPHPPPALYRCDENRIGKCVAPVQFGLGLGAQEMGSVYPIPSGSEPAGSKVPVLASSIITSVAGQSEVVKKR